MTSGKVHVYSSGAKWCYYYAFTCNRTKRYRPRPRFVRLIPKSCPNPNPNPNPNPPSFYLLAHLLPYSPLLTWSKGRNLAPPMPKQMLLQLPSELRNRIWHLSVVQHHTIHIKRHQRQAMARPLLLKSGKRRVQSSTKITKLALAFTCRQTYREVIPIYYSLNAFSFYWTPALKISVAAVIGSGKRRKITHKWLHSTHAPAIRSLNALPDLDREDLPIAFLHCSKLLGQLVTYVKRHSHFVITRHAKADKNPKLMDWVDYGRPTPPLFDFSQLEGRAC